MKGDSIVIRGERVPFAAAINHWRCGQCSSKLEIRTIIDQGIRTELVCSQDRGHPADAFIPASMVEQAGRKQFEYWAKLRKEINPMGFVKDRHDSEGGILAPASVRVAGKINLGEKREDGRGAKPLPYFVFKIYASGAEADALQGQVLAAIEQYAPGQDARFPKVLPVFLPANSLELVAKSEYKLPGKEGRARCVGDGETIQYKLGARNLVEVYDGEVVVKTARVDNAEYFEGDTIPCPGRRHKEHWSHCEKCRFRFEGKFQLAGLPYIWSLATGDQKFYNQYFTVLEMMEGHVQVGHARFMSEIPLLLRRYEGEVSRPSQGENGFMVTPQEMPLLSVEIHPMWLVQVEAPRAFALDGGEAPALAAPQRKRLPQGEIEEPEPVQPEPATVTIHADGLPGVPMADLRGLWNTPEEMRNSIVEGAIRHLGMSREAAVAAIEQYKTSVTGIGDLWTCLRQHIQAQFVPEEESPPQEVAEAPPNS